MSRVARQMYGPPALKRNGIASAVLLLLMIAAGLFEFFNDDRRLGEKMLVISFALICLIALGWYISPFRRGAKSGEHP